MNFSPQGRGHYDEALKKAQRDIDKLLKQINEISGVAASDTGLAHPSQWDLEADKHALQHGIPLQVARCTKIINADKEDPMYVINVKQFAKFVVELNDTVAPTDIEEGMRVAVDRVKYKIHLPLPPRIDSSVTAMQLDDKPDVTYADIGGCKEEISKLKEIVEMPLLHVG